MTVRKVTPTETWRPVAGFEGLYEVSDAGRVRSLHWKAPKFLRPTSDSIGRLSVDLRAEGKRSMRRVHRLVLETFVGLPPAGTEGCHNDGNPANNCVANLRWDTRQSNVDDRRRHGTDNAGERHLRARFTEEDVRRIREARLFGAHQPTLAQIYGTSQGRISTIVNRRAWRHV